MGCRAAGPQSNNRTRPPRLGLLRLLPDRSAALYRPALLPNGDALTDYPAAPQQSLPNSQSATDQWPTGGPAPQKQAPRKVPQANRPRSPEADRRGYLLTDSGSQDWLPYLLLAAPDRLDDTKEKDQSAECHVVAVVPRLTQGPTHWRMATDCPPDCPTSDEAPKWRSARLRRNHRLPQSRTPGRTALTSRSPGRMASPSRLRSSARPRMPGAEAVAMDSGEQPGGQQPAVALLTGVLTIKRKSEGP